MVILELFAGTRCISKAFEKRGHTCYTIEWNRDFDNISLYADISKITSEDIISLCGRVPDVIWASPDCTTYSVAAIGKHRVRAGNGCLFPKTDYALFCDETNAHVLELIEELDPHLWFIENPVGGMRKSWFMKDKNCFRNTVTYCQYGDIRQKPTDIWTNHPNPKFKPPCKRGASCHEAAPRGSRTGTQGLQGKALRAQIPEQLCEHIVQICEEYLKGKVQS